MGDAAADEENQGHASASASASVSWGESARGSVPSNDRRRVGGRGGIYTYANAGREAGYNALEMEIGIDERGRRTYAYAQT